MFSFCVHHFSLTHQINQCIVNANMGRQPVAMETAWLEWIPSGSVWLIFLAKYLRLHIRVVYINMTQQYNC